MLLQQAECRGHQSRRLPPKKSHRQLFRMNSAIRAVHLVRPDMPRRRILDFLHRLIHLECLEVSHVQSVEINHPKTCFMLLLLVVGQNLFSKVENEINNQLSQFEVHYDWIGVFVSSRYEIFSIKCSLCLISIVNSYVQTINIINHHVRYQNAIKSKVFY